MRRLILFRHGKAEMAGLTGGDKDRPLAERGRTDSLNTAMWLRDSGYSPDIVYVSPAARTQATWTSARPAFPDTTVETDASLYLGGTDIIMDIFDEAPAESPTVMVVGHNPGLQELGLQLAEDGGAPLEQVTRLGDGFPTAAAAVFRLEPAGAFVLEAIYEPPRVQGDPPRWTYRGAVAGDPA
jgi:phosphohistidine phosphatase